MLPISDEAAPFAFDHTTAPSEADREPYLAAECPKIERDAIEMTTAGLLPQCWRDDVDLQTVTSDPALAEPVRPSVDSEDWVLSDEDKLHLGNVPEDPLIADIVRLNDTSVRLNNAIQVGAACGKVPLPRVSDYLAAGDEASELFMRHVQNLGRKSAKELDVLVRKVAALVQHPPGPSRHSAPELRRRLAGQFASVTVVEALADYDMPVRLQKALEKTGYADGPLSVLLDDYPKLRPKLLRMSNVGRTSLAAADRILLDIVTEDLRALGLTASQAVTGALLAVEALDPGADDRRELTTILDRFALEATDGQEALPAEPLEPLSKPLQAPSLPPPPIESCVHEALVLLDRKRSLEAAYRPVCVRGTLPSLV